MSKFKHGDNVKVRFESDQVEYGTVEEVDLSWVWVTTPKHKSFPYMEDEVEHVTDAKEWLGNFLLQEGES